MTQSNISVLATKQGLQLKGDLVYANVSDVVKVGDELLRQHNSDNVVFSCVEINRLDSAGISLFLEWKRLCLQLNKNCQFEGLPQQAVSLIQTYKLNNLLALA